MIQCSHCINKIHCSLYVRAVKFMEFITFDSNMVSQYLYMNTYFTIGRFFASSSFFYFFFNILIKNWMVKLNLIYFFLNIQNWMVKLNLIYYNNLLFPRIYKKGRTLLSYLLYEQHPTQKRFYNRETIPSMRILLWLKVLPLYHDWLKFLN